ncbi:MAG TPA: electron transport complex subunit RsxC [Treponemataceae bacterium]|nr:electron transport complex subunit RsxC [Treponemataceae bacterium]
MKIRTFKGGVHPPERKEGSRALPIESAFPSTKTVWIPITQGGAPNKPIVQVGDSVARGQKIAETDAFMSAPVHASIAGTVKKIETHLVVGNVDAPCIVIEGDDSGRTDFMPVLDPFTCTREAALARVRTAGIVGMGGASFPAHVKLSPPKGTKIDYLIANGAECEPYLTIDARTIEEHAASIVDGIAIAMYITGAAEGIIALEDNKANLVPVLEKAISGQKCVPVGPGACNISVSVCKTKYPQGGEKMLIKALVGREVPSGGLPAACGCVVQNVGTLKAISEAFRQGKPLIDRALTVSGGACKTPKNIEVPVGTLVGDLIPQTVELNPGVAKIVSGGPMMGLAMKSASFPVQKNTSGVLFLTAGETCTDEESPCIGCGRCITVCSCRLAPVLVVRALKGDDLEEAKRCGLMDCVECGTCAYVCPARVKLVQHFKIGKQLVRAEMAKAAARAAAKGAK